MSIKSKSNSVDDEMKFDENAPQPRLCHLKKWPHFQGYGFNLHAERVKLGQHIGKVDSKSPAESAGLREGDRIIEVNYVNISNENHQQVVKRIRNGLVTDNVLNENEVVLLVVDSETDEYYKKLNVIVKNDFPNILELTTKLVDDSNSIDSNNNIVETKSLSKVKIELNDSAALANQNDIKLENSNLSTSSITSSSKSINNNANNTTENNDNTTNNNQECLNSNSDNNLDIDQIQPVINEDQQDLLDKNKMDKKSVSSTSNLSVNSFDNHSKSSKSTIETTPPPLQVIAPKREAPLNDSQQQIKSSSTENKSNTKPPNGTIDPFRRTKAELPNLKYIIDSESKILNENSSNDSIYCHFKNNNIINQNRTSNTVYTLSKKFTEKPARPPPPTLTSASLNYKKITSNSNRSSIYFNFNNYEDEKKCLDSYLEMSAAEFKTYLKSKSRNDPRIAPVDMKQKFQMFQDM